MNIRHLQHIRLNQLAIRVTGGGAVQDAIQWRG
jgi:hypothetical protein